MTETSMSSGDSKTQTKSDHICSKAIYCPKEDCTHRTLHVHRNVCDYSYCGALVKRVSCIKIKLKEGLPVRFLFYL